MALHSRPMSAAELQSPSATPPFLTAMQHRLVSYTRSFHR